MKAKLGDLQELGGQSTWKIYWRKGGKFGLQQNYHKNEKPKFSMEITKKFNDALSRQANEAIWIFSRPDQFNI